MKMIGRSGWWAALVAACAIALPMASALAAEEPAPGPVTDEWFVWVTPGHEAQFEAAAKEHVAWRKQAGDPHQWNTYQPSIGSDLGYFVFRAEGLQWADVDAGNRWAETAKANQHWNEHVNPHVARYEHYLGVSEPSASYWMDSDDTTMFAVNTIAVKPGQWRHVKGAFESYVKAATASKWDRHWAVERVVGGQGGIIVARPLRSVADLADPPVSFRDMFIKFMGSEDAAQATMDKVTNGLGDASTTVYTWRKDLSTPK